MDKIEYLQGVRDEARRIGDHGLLRAVTADLARLGHGDPPVGPVPVETTMVQAPERAVPAKRRGRPPRPRCEHGMIVDRCPECREFAD